MDISNTKAHYDRSIDIVRSALPQMSELKIPVTPHNYAVWYEYLAESNAGLQEEMDALLRREEPITDSDMRGLYERHLEERSEKLQVAKSALGRMLSTLINHIDQADGQYGGFSSELADISENLSSDSSRDDLSALVERAMQATASALEHGAKLKAQISTLATEMEEVRGELIRSQEAARVDTLTGLYNRRAFQEVLETLSSTAHESTYAPCLLLVDIDRFKSVNDTHGHLVGDFVLQKVATEIKESVRGRDLVVRFGGEEFALLLRDTSRTGCQAVAENIRACVEQSVIALPDGLAEVKRLSITVSIGGAWYREEEPIDTFIGRADRHLYRSKEQGRNRVTWENQAGREK